MIGAGVFSAWGPAADGGRDRPPRSVSSSPPPSRSATPRPRRSSPPCTPSRAAPTSTPATSSGRSGDTSPGGASSSARPPRASRLALTAGAYLWPEHARLVGVVAVGAVAIVNIGGLTRTVVVTKACSRSPSWRSPRSSSPGGRVRRRRVARLTPIDTSPAGVLRAAGFLFFAFAGYARIATLGEEVRDPATTIPKAIPRALAGVLVIYADRGCHAARHRARRARSRRSDAPLGLVVSASRFDWLAPIVRVGAGIAALGVLLNLVPGVSRTVLAMARRRELPHWFATIDERRSLPVRAEVVVTVVVIVLDRDARPPWRHRLLRRHHPHLLRDHQRRLPDAPPGPAPLAPMDRRRSASPAASPSPSCCRSPRRSPAPPCSSPASSSVGSPGRPSWTSHRRNPDGHTATDRGRSRWRRRPRGAGRSASSGRRRGRRASPRTRCGRRRGRRPDRGR